MRKLGWALVLALLMHSSPGMGSNRYAMTGDLAKTQLDKTYAESGEVSNSVYAATEGFFTVETAPDATKSRLIWDRIHAFFERNNLPIEPHISLSNQIEGWLALLNWQITEKTLERTKEEIKQLEQDALECTKQANNAEFTAMSALDHKRMLLHRRHAAEFEELKKVHLLKAGGLEIQAQTYLDRACLYGNPSAIVYRVKEVRDEFYNDPATSFDLVRNLLDKWVDKKHIRAMQIKRDALAASPNDLAYCGYELNPQGAKDLNERLIAMGSLEARGEAPIEAMARSKVVLSVLPEPDRISMTILQYIKKEWNARWHDTTIEQVFEICNLKALITIWMLFSVTDEDGKYTARVLERLKQLPLTYEQVHEAYGLLKGENVPVLALQFALAKGYVPEELASMGK